MRRALGQILSADSDSTVGLRQAMSWVLLAAGAGLATLAWVVPGYLTARGFPLDDSWIHAVYGRSVATHFRLAYNPGIPATGATSPLWALVVALPHLVASRVDVVVAAIKLIGLVLHVLTAVLLLRAFTVGARVAWPALVGATLVAFHPDLISGSASGMELSLSTALAALVLVTVSAGSALPYFGVALVAPLARPELAVVCAALPAALYARSDLRRAMRFVGSAVAGTVVSFGALALRNLAVSGLPLPATFYAKAWSGNLPIHTAEYVGFSQLLGQFAIADSSALVGGASIVALTFIVRPGADPARQRAAAALLAAMAFCAVSFVLVRPIDPGAFYHQRYVMPVLPLIVVSLPALIDAALGFLVRSRTGLAGARAAVLVLLVAALLVHAPVRYARLDNDARNIDDVQVAEGRALASAPPDHVVWAVDAGAIRYFGSPFVVDLIGLNNADVLGPGAQTFLDARRPRFIEVVPQWSALDPPSSQRLRAHAFSPSTPYTVTNFLPTQQHFLVRCEAHVGGILQVRGRAFAFSCAP